MRTSEFSGRDVGATALVATALGLYALNGAGLAVPGLGSDRVMSVVVLMLGVLACGAGKPEELLSAPGLTSRVVGRMLSALGAVTFGFGVAAIVTGSAALLTVLMTGTLLLWAVATGRHLTAAPRDHAKTT